MMERQKRFNEKKRKKEVVREEGEEANEMVWILFSLKLC